MTDTEPSPHKDPLVAWLIRQLEMGIKGIRPELLTLSHLDVSERQAPMERFPIENHHEAAANDFASNLRFLARMDAEHREGLQRYAVHIYWPSETKEPPSYTMFSVDGSVVRNEQIVMATEPPTTEGVLKQTMRHLELFVRLDTESRLRTATDTAQREDRLLARINDLEIGRMKFVELTETLISAEAERTLAHKSAEHKERRMDEALEEVKGIVGLIKPKLLAKFTGGKLDEDSSATMAMFRFLFEGMTIEQMKTMQATLDPDKQSAFVELYKRVMGMAAEDKKKDSGGDSTAAGDPTKH